MQTATHQPEVINAARLAALERKRARTSPQPAAVVPLDLETRTAVDTQTAAAHLNRRPQTLRGWACNEDGPLRPMRVNGRLAWRVSDLRRVLGLL